MPSPMILGCHGLLVADQRPKSNEQLVLNVTFAAFPNMVMAFRQRL